MQNLQMLKPGELLIDKWESFYQPEGGTSYDATIFNSNSRIIIRLREKISINNIVKPMLQYTSNIGFICINKADITTIEVQKLFMDNKCIVQLKDNTRHCFGRGVLGVEKMANSLLKGTSITTAGKLAGVKNISGQQLQETKYYKNGLYSSVTLLIVGFILFMITLGKSNFNLFDMAKVLLCAFCFFAATLYSITMLFKIKTNYAGLKNKKIITVIFGLIITAIIAASFLPEVIATIMRF